MGATSLCDRVSGLFSQLVLGKVTPKETGIKGVADIAKKSPLDPALPVISHEEYDKMIGQPSFRFEGYVKLSDKFPPFYVNGTKVDANGVPVWLWAGEDQQTFFCDSKESVRLYSVSVSRDYGGGSFNRFNLSDGFTRETILAYFDIVVDRVKNKVPVQRINASYECVAKFH